MPGAAAPATAGDVAPERPRHHDQAEQRRGGDRDRGGVLALEHARTRAARRTRPARRTPSAPGRRRARTAAGPPGSRARSSSPRKGARRRPGTSRASRCPRRARPRSSSAAPARRPRTAAASPSWIVAATRSASPAERPCASLLGDRARQQLLDRAVDHRGGQEHRRPQHRDLAVGVAAERVRRERVERVGQQPGDADQRREQRRAAAVGHALRRRLAGRRLTRSGRCTSAIVHGSGERSSTISP